MILKLHFILLVLLLIFFGCQSNTENGVESQKVELSNDQEGPLLVSTKKEYTQFDRSSSKAKIAQKIANKAPLYIHLKVPLCDNENQGIVPVSKSLGDGFNLSTNLYWGAKYGVKNYFKKFTNWKLLTSKKDVNESILERLIFYRKDKNGVPAYLVADAYRGDRMKVCLTDFFNAIAGNTAQDIQIEDHKIGIESHADLLLFSGHNGLMDYDLEVQPSSDEEVREVAVIGCISYDYFKDHLRYAKGYPLLTTTNLMAPEAYILNAIIDSWMNLEEGEKVRKAAGKAYHDYQKCGIKGATKLFKTGW